MLYEVRYSELMGGYYVRQTVSEEIVETSYTGMPERAVALAVRMSGYETADEWAAALKAARERDKK